MFQKFGPSRPPQRDGFGPWWSVRSTFMIRGAEYEFSGWHSERYHLNQPPGVGIAYFFPVEPGHPAIKVTNRSPDRRRVETVTAWHYPSENPTPQPTARAPRVLWRPLRGVLAIDAIEGAVVA